jgi:hypothetical protein
MLKFSPGTYVAGYWVRGLVARGDATEVYEVVDQNGVRRALKVLERQGPLDSAPQRRLALAGDVAAMVEHPNVVRYHDIDIHEGKVVLVLDFVDGVDLRRVLDEAGGKLEPLHAVSLLLQAAEGIAAVHERSVIHRDLKPERRAGGEGARGCTPGPGHYRAPRRTAPPVRPPRTRAHPLRRVARHGASWARGRGAACGEAQAAA